MILNRDLTNIKHKLQKRVKRKNLEIKRVENFGTHVGY